MANAVIRSSSLNRRQHLDMTSLDERGGPPLAARHDLSLERDSHTPRVFARAGRAHGIRGGGAFGQFPVLSVEDDPRHLPQATRDASKRPG